MLASELKRRDRRVGSQAFLEPVSPRAGLYGNPLRKFGGGFGIAPPAVSDPTAIAAFPVRQDRSPLAKALGGGRHWTSPDPFYSVFVPCLY